MKKKSHIVIKVGTSTLTKGGTKLVKQEMLTIAQQLAELQEDGMRVILVSSGSVCAGRDYIQPHNNDRLLSSKQMLSAVGQVHLMQTWTGLFEIYGITVGQLLLSKGDFSNRQGYLNVRNTIASLLDHRIIPIINENDSVATRELLIGDNDNLSALVANLVAADLLILLTDQEGLYSSNPDLDPNAKLIKNISKVDSSIYKIAGGTNKSLGMGAGGMFTKVEAAQLAAKSGTPTVIASAEYPNVIVNIINGETIGTRFSAETTPLESRKRWLLSEKSCGALMIDAGAEKKLLREGSSLLPVGITIVPKEKTYERGDVIQINSPDGHSIGVGITNYSSNEIDQLKGIHSSQIESILGYSYGPEVIHRDNMILFNLGDQ